MEKSRSFNIPVFRIHTYYAFMLAFSHILLLTLKKEKKKEQKERRQNRDQTGLRTWVSVLRVMYDFSLAVMLGWHACPTNTLLKMYMVFIVMLRLIPCINSFFNFSPSCCCLLLSNNRDLSSRNKCIWLWTFALCFSANPEQFKTKLSRKREEDSMKFKIIQQNIMQFQNVRF